MTRSTLAMVVSKAVVESTSSSARAALAESAMPFSSSRRICRRAASSPCRAPCSLRLRIVERTPPRAKVPAIPGPYSLTGILTIIAGANSLTSIDAAISPTKARREIPGMSVLQRTLCFLKELIRHVNEKIAAVELLATRSALPETR